MNAQELVDSLSDTFLCEIISANLEQPRLLADMLSSIEYLQNKDEILGKVNACEILDSEEPGISDVKSEGGRAVFRYEMPFVLIVKNDKEQILRITATASGNCSVLESFNWSDFEWDDMNRTEILEHKELAEFSDLQFFDVECDDLTVK